MKTSEAAYVLLFSRTDAGYVLAAYIRKKYEEGGCGGREACDCVIDSGGNANRENVDGNIGIGKDVGAEEGDISLQRMWPQYGKGVSHCMSPEVGGELAVLRCGGKKWM